MGDPNEGNVKETTALIDLAGGMTAVSTSSFHSILVRLA
jgi:hypothetical protein